MSIDTCPTTGKIVYSSPQAAWKAATAIRERNRTEVGSRSRVRSASIGYRCGFCGFWHVTSKGRRR